MIADCRQCEQRQPSAAANLVAFGVRAKFGGAGKFVQKKLVAGGPYHFTPSQGPTRDPDSPRPHHPPPDDQHTDDQHASGQRAPDQHTDDCLGVAVVAVPEEVDSEPPWQSWQSPCSRAQRIRPSPDPVAVVAVVAVVFKIDFARGSRGSRCASRFCYIL